MKKTIALAAVMAAISAPAMAGDVAAGKVAAAVCAGCHGPEGVSFNPSYPNLAGQNAPYLENAIKDYRDGKRTGTNAIIMKPMVASVTDEKAADLAAYFSSLGK